MPRAEELEVTLAVVRVLEGLEVEYLVGGSVASSVFGVPRATLDVDLVADLREGHVAGFVGAIQDGFYVDPDAVRDAVCRRASFNVIHLATMLKVDVFVLKPDPLSRSAMARRRRLDLPGTPPAAIEVASPEDIVLQKLHWYRLGEGVSERQWRDVLGVLRVQAGRLDEEYLRRWAPGLGVADLLARALVEAAA